MRKVLLAAIVMVLLWVPANAQTASDEEWTARVKAALLEPPSHPRRVMLVFPLVEESSEDGTVGWGHGLISAQAMWRSSFTPERLLDTWDFHCLGLFVEQQLWGPGRKVTEKKIDAALAAFDCDNYTTGTLAVLDDGYHADLTFHGAAGEEKKTYEGPRDQLHVLPCRIAEDVVDYLGVEVTESQRAALRTPMLSGTDVFREVAERYYSFWLLRGTWEVFWEDLADRENTPWVEEMWFLNYVTVDPELVYDAWGKPRPRHQGTWFDFLRAARHWQDTENISTDPDWQASLGRMRRRVVDLMVPLLQEDPYNCDLLDLLIMCLEALEESDLAELAIARFAILYPSSHLGVYLRGQALVHYAWEARGSGWAHTVSEEGWELFHARLQRAKEDLETAATMEPCFWHAHSELLNVAMGLGLPDSYADLHFNKAIEACPTDPTAYMRLSVMREPKWGGSIEEMIHAARMAVDTGLYESPVPAVIWDAHMNAIEYLPDEAYTANFTQYFCDPAVRDEIVSALEKTIERNPYDYTDMTKLLMLALWTNDRELARRQIGRLGTNLDGESASNIDRAMLGPTELQDIVRWLETDKTDIWTAAVIGDVDLVRQLLDEGAQVQAINEDGQTLLHMAATRGNVNLVDLLVERGADVDLPDASGQPPLLLAVRANSLGAAKRLLETGADPDATDSEGRTAVHAAVEVCEGLVVRELIMLACDPDLADNRSHTPLHLASSWAWPAVANALLASGADPNIATNDGQTALHFAGKKGSVVICRSLLAHGAEVDAVDNWGVTPAGRAASGGFPETMGVLLDHGADVNGCDPDKGYTPLHRTGFADADHPECAKVLFEHGAEVDVRTVREGMTPLHYAAERKKPGVAKVLIDAGADVNAADNKGKTPLSFAARNNHPELIELLLAAGADIEKQDNSQMRPVHHAALCKEGGAEAMKVLVEHGADVNALDKWGNAPLQSAARGGQKEVVEVLIEAGADLALLRKGKTAEQQAQEKGFTEIATLLQAAARQTEGP
jgi:ankyrin repeat protein